MPPFPHVFEQDDHLDQAPTSASTIFGKEKNILL